MSKSSSLAEVRPNGNALQGEGKAVHREAKPRRRGTLAYRVEAVGKELSALPMKPLLIGAGIGAALFGVALAVGSKRRVSASPLSGMERALTKTALVALGRVVSGQTVRTVTSSALLDVADAMKR
jgi:hypothetical protein